MRLVALCLCALLASCGSSEGDKESASEAKNPKMIQAKKSVESPDKKSAAVNKKKSGKTNKKPNLKPTKIVHQSPGQKPKHVSFDCDGVYQHPSHPCRDSQVNVVNQSGHDEFHVRIEGRNYHFGRRFLSGYDWEDAEYCINSLMHDGVAVGGNWNVDRRFLNGPALTWSRFRDRDRSTGRIVILKTGLVGRWTIEPTPGTITCVLGQNIFNRIEVPSCNQSTVVVGNRLWGTHQTYCR